MCVTLFFAYLPYMPSPSLCQVDVARAFIGFCYYVLGEQDTPPSLAWYHNPIYVAKLVVYLKARGVGRSVGLPLLTLGKPLHNPYKSLLYSFLGPTSTNMSP